MRVLVKRARASGPQDRLSCAIVLDMQATVTSEAMLASSKFAISRLPVMQLLHRLEHAREPVALELGDFDPTTLTDEELGDVAQQCAREIGRRMADACP